MAFWILRDDGQIIRVNESVMRHSAGIVERQPYTEEGLQLLQIRKTKLLMEQQAKANANDSNQQKFRTSSTSPNPTRTS